MDRPIVCVGALVQRSDGRVLLIQTNKWRGLWGVPGGKVEWGELLTEAVAREFWEETELKLSEIQQVQMQEVIFSDEFYQPVHMLLIDFVARAEGEVNPNQEIQRWVWVTFEEAIQYPLNRPTRSLIEQVQRLGWV